MLKTSILSTLLTFTLFFQACSSDADQNANAMVSTNEYVLTAINNTQYIVKKEPNGFSVENTKGKVIILDIFATWCPPCKAAASHLSSLQAKYKDNLVIIGIKIEDDISNEKLYEFR